MGGVMWENGGHLNEKCKIENSKWGKEGNGEWEDERT
jgi:hypothetical protein